MLIPNGTMILAVLVLLMVVAVVVVISILLTAGSKSIPYPAPVTTPASRLSALEALRSQGLITEMEYAARRQAIIESV